KVTSQDFCPVPTDGQMALLEQLMAAVEQGGCTPPTWEELCAKFKINFEQSKELLLWLMNKNKLTRLPGGLVIATAVVQQALHCLYTQLRRKEFSLAEARDILGISRKYALPLLEYADQQKITLRQGDKRYFIQEVSGEK
ncbi:MAG: SelB C-terminal domain-containing protein, partial [Clostridiales bacterium]